MTLTIHEKPMSGWPCAVSTDHTIEQPSPNARLRGAQALTSSKAPLSRFSTPRSAAGSQKSMKHHVNSVDRISTAEAVTSLSSYGDDRRVEHNMQR